MRDVNFDAALPRRLRDAVSPGAKTLAGLPCDGCVGRSFNLCKPLDDTRLKVMLGLGGIRRWKKRRFPGLKKTPPGKAKPSSSSTKAG